MSFIDPNDFEMVAMDTASEMAGAYIQSLEPDPIYWGGDGAPKNTEFNPTDFTHWSPSQWNEFINVICGSYVNSLMEQQDNLRRAVEKINNMPLPVGDLIKFPSFKTE